MNFSSLEAVGSVAYKEFLHIWRDRRVLAVILVLPPIFTLVFGHAFEVGKLKGVPALLINQDDTERTKRFVDLALQDETFQWRQDAPKEGNPADLLGNKVQAALVIPPGWSQSLSEGEPKALQAYLDGSDTNNAQQLEGSIFETLGDFQKGEHQYVIDALPEEVIEMGKRLPVTVRKGFVSLMEQWPVERTVLYNPELRFINYVTPGVIGLILQLLTVTLMACTIARERESGTLYQLMVTSLRRGEIVIGKILPYLAVSIFLILIIFVLTGWHFRVEFFRPGLLALLCLLFLLCSLGLGLLISAFSRTQTQAIQFSVFFLLPVFVLSGAFAPLEQLPRFLRYVSELFPLTHFCRAFRMVNLYRADISYVTLDLTVLFLGAVVTFVGAAFLLKRVEQ